MDTEQQIILSISLLTSNRKDTIRKCLDSLAPLRQQVSSELIIVDTGCDDEMLGIISEYADQIVPFRWCDDFAKARNAGLEKARGEWFLFIDDDEWFEDVSEIVSFFVTGEYKNYTIGKYVQRNYKDIQGTSYEDVWVVRMAKFGSIVRFQGCIHEAVRVYDGATKYFHDYVHHYGYVFKSKKEIYRHYQRNETLLKKMLKEERHNMRWWTHLAQEYWAVQEYSKLLDLCQEALTMIQPWSYEGIEKTRGCFYVGRVLAAQYLYRYGDAICYLKEALLDRGNSRMCLTKLFSLGAILYYETQDYAHCIESIRCYLVCYQDADFEKEKEKDSIIFINDAYEKNIYSCVMSLILSVAVKEKDIEVVKEYFDQLDWLQGNLVVYDANLFLALINFIADSSYDDYFVHMAQTIMDRAELDPGLKNIVQNALREIEVNNKGEHFSRIVQVFSKVESEDYYLDYLKICAAGMGYSTDRELLELCYERLFQKVSNVFELDDSVWEVAKLNEIELEPLFLHIDYRLWVQDIDTFCKNTTLEQISYYTNLLAGIQTKTDIRYQYFYLKTLEARLFYGEARENYDSLHELLQEFVSSHLEFFLYYYREEAFQGEMELLPDSCKVAVYLNEAFQKESEKDYRAVMSILTECIGKCASLNETIQVYGHMYVAKLKEQLQLM